MNGVRSCGYLFLHLMTIGLIIPSQLLSPFIRVCETLFYYIYVCFCFNINNKL